MEKQEGEIGSAWGQLMTSIARAEEQIRRHTAADPAAQAEGCRFVWRVFSAMREFILEQDPRLPSFVPVMTPTRKFFADNPDTLYHRAPLRGDLSYRITGQRGSCTYLGFCAYGQSTGGIEILGTLSDQDLCTDPDGRFEIVISADRPSDAPNWIGIREGARSLVARQYFTDREAESPASYSIGLTCSSRHPIGGELDPQEFSRRLLVCGQSLERAVGATLRATGGWSKEPNTISFDSDAGELADLFPTPDNHYVGGWFRLEPNEALVIELSPPDCRYWNLHLMSRWLESLDGRGNPVSLNLAQAIPCGDDGQVRFIISASDPGRANWLDTGGRREGCFALRWLQASTPPERPACHLVKLAEL